MRGFSVILLTGLAVTLSPAGGVLHVPQKRAAREVFPAGNYDIRLHDRAALERLIQSAAPRNVPGVAQAAGDRRRAMREALEKLRTRIPGLQAQFSPISGSAEVVRTSVGTLTPRATGRSARDVAFGFLRDNAAVYGLSDEQAARLEFLGESVSRRSGLRMVRLRQTVHGLPVFQSETRAIVDRDGRLVRTIGRLVPGVETSRVPVSHRIPVQAGLKAALASVGIEAEAARMIVVGAAADGREAEILPGVAEVRRTVKTRLVHFPLAPGVLTPAWSQVLFVEGPEDWYILVDARTGDLLYRKNIQASASTQQARFSVYTQGSGRPADSPAPASPNSVAPGAGTQFPELSRTIESMLSIQDPSASPDGWIPDDGTATTGNNVDAYLDRDGDDLPDTGTLDSNGRPVGNPDASGRNRDFLGVAPRDYTYSPSPTAGNPDAGDDPSAPGYQRGVVTNLFYIANYFHDRLYDLGFDEAAGNFQANNFGLGGAGGDPLLAEAQQAASSGSGNNANISVPPDGQSAMMRMFLWTSPSPTRDGSLDAEIVLHELTHGLSNRLIGDAAGLNWVPGGGMGEGWSDFYALSLLNGGPADAPGGRYAAGAYVTYGLFGTYLDNYVYGVRRFPYTTDNSVNPLTWADADDITDNMSGGLAPSPVGFEANGAAEVHNIGEIWALTLWEVRSRIIAAGGGDVAGGNETTLQIVTDALKMTPVDPSFTQARDAILDADCAGNACANEESVWGGFADRGLGYRAEASLGIATHVGVRESFSAPYLDVAGVTVDDSVGDGNGFPDPGETVSITVQLLNPWRGAAKGVASAAAVLSSSTPGVTITDAASTYGPIPSQGIV